MPQGLYITMVTKLLCISSQDTDPDLLLNSTSTILHPRQLLAPFFHQHIVSFFCPGESLTYQSGMHARHSTLKMDPKWRNQCRKNSPLNGVGNLNDKNFNGPLFGFKTQKQPHKLCNTGLLSKKERIPGKRVPNVPHEI